MKKNKFPLILLLFATAQITMGSVENGTFILTLKNPVTEGIISWGRVSISGPTAAERSVNSNGEAEFIGLPSGTYTIVAVSNGFQRRMNQVKLDFKQRSQHTMTMMLPPNKPVSYNSPSDSTPGSKPATTAPSLEPLRRIERPAPIENPGRPVPVRSEQPAPSTTAIPIIRKLEVPVLELPSSRHNSPSPSAPAAEPQAPPLSVEAETELFSEQIQTRMKQHLSTKLHESEVYNIINGIGGVHLRYSEAHGLEAENAAKGMIVTGVTGALTLLFTGIFIAALFFKSKDMSGFGKMFFSCATLMLLLLCAAAWLLFAGFGIALFDMNVQSAATSRTTQPSPDWEPGEEM
ncbi:MAG: hypothetical protein JXR78_12585 [Victivallales bacterium]|nr:hypothetical protein [Victivallales bacterium]